MREMHYYQWEIWDAVLEAYRVEPKRDEYMTPSWEGEFKENVLITVGVHDKVWWADSTAYGRVVCVESSDWGLNRVWKIPADFDWAALLPGDTEYQPTVKTHRLQVADFEIEARFRWSDNNQGRFEFHFYRDGQLLMQPEPSWDKQIHPQHTSVIAQYNLGNFRLDRFPTLSDRQIKEMNFPDEHLSRDNHFGRTILFSDEQKTALLQFCQDEVARIAEETAVAVETRQRLTRNHLSALALMSDYIGYSTRIEITGHLNVYEVSPVFLVKMFRAEQAERAEKEAIWDTREASGKTIVALKRCWECGTTRITGQLLRGGKVVKMSRELFDQARAAQAEAHRRSMAAVTSDTIISSVGFDPNPDSKFEFVILDTDYYCGC